MTMIVLALAWLLGIVSADNLKLPAQPLLALAGASAFLATTG